MEREEVQKPTGHIARRMRWGYIALGVCVFGFLLLYFAKLHPLMMHDGDDWGYSSYTRTLLPIWGGWNPTRVLPELISPLIAYAAAYLVMPFVGDLSWAMVYTYALFFSTLLTVYVMLFVRFIRRRFSLPDGWAIVQGMLFFISHFLILRSKVNGNVHMFYCWNVNTYFFYLLPDILGASLVLYFSADRGRSFAVNWKRPLEAGGIFSILYLAIFSNMFSNYIIAVFAGLIVLSRLLRALKERGKLACVFSENAWLLVVLALWMVCAVFEVSGGRAESLATEEAFIDRLKMVYSGLLEVIASLNRLFTVVCLIAIAAACILYILPHERKACDAALGESLVVLAAAFVLSSCYLVLLTATAAPPYITRPEVIFGAMFMMLLLVMVAMAYVMRRVPQLAFLLPVICLVFAFETDTRWSTFKESNVDNMSVYECAAINQAVIDQIIAADQRGETYAKIDVPNGPYWYMADSVAVTLLKCGMIENEIYASNVFIDDFYEKYDIQ